MESKGRQLHALAETARESGEFQKALDYTDQATLAYQKDGDLFGLAEVQSSRQSTFKQLYRNTEDPVYLSLEKYAAMAAVEIAEKSGIKESLGIPYHNLGKYYYEVHEYENAAEFFKKAVEYLTNYPSDRHTRPSVIPDIQGHQFTADYYAGDKTALERAEKALTALKNADEPSKYNKDVWLSGAHLRIAEMLRKDDPEKAKEHLQKAKEIIDANDKLVLRRKQWEKLAASFN